MLDMRYNEMWNDWDGTGEVQKPKMGSPQGQLELSWKKLNVTVEQTIHKFFLQSKIIYNQILHNGKR